MSTQRISASSRHGYTLIAVLALLIVAAGFFGNWTQQALRNHRQAKQQHKRAQAEWLVYAGLSRASARLQQDSTYRGETWQIEPEELGQSYAAEVFIQIQPVGPDNNNSGAKQITARVRLPAQNHRIQLTRTLPLD